MGARGSFLGTVHFLRNRGTIYVDGFRTSLQVGILGAGVAKGAGFTGTEAALLLGIGTVIGLEVFKLLGGLFDRSRGVIHAQNLAEMNVNPYAKRSLALLKDIRKALNGRPPRRQAAAPRRAGRAG